MISATRKNIREEVINLFLIEGTELKFDTWAEAVSYLIDNPEIKWEGGRIIYDE